MLRLCLFDLLALALCAMSFPAVAAEQRLLVDPHAADARVAAGGVPHVVVYDPETPAGALLVWLPGTGGQATGGLAAFFETARAQGYRQLSLSYPTTPAVAQVCVPARLRAQPDCAARFRQQRVWGDLADAPVDDRAEDAIVPRLTQLLRQLVQADPAGAWAQYLDGAEPRWARIVLAGQSQGGGMAAYLAQTRPVAGVLMFSGGWDHGANGEIAAWYRRASVTPPERWFASYHVEEPMAPTMARIYRVLAVPPAQVHALDLPVRGRSPHTEGISNTAYRPFWVEALPRQP